MVISLSLRPPCLDNEFQDSQGYVARPPSQETTATTKAALFLLDKIGKSIMGKSSSFPNYLIQQIYLVCSVN